MSYCSERAGLAWSCQKWPSLHLMKSQASILVHYCLCPVYVGQLSLTAWHLGGVQWILMTFSLPKQKEACRDGVGIAYCDINSIHGHFFFYLVRVHTESKRSGTVKHLLTLLWSRRDRRCCHRHIRKIQGRCARRKIFLWFNHCIAGSGETLRSWAATLPYFTAR